jgi:basic amino acid/polyamine antiporter, APA family
MPMSQRDAGLIRSIGIRGLAISTINAVVGATIFAIPGTAAACVGVYAPLAFVFCAISIGAVAICFAEGGSRIATSGGAYGCIEAAFGPLAGYVAGTLLWVSDVLAHGGIASALSEAAASLAPAPFKAGLRALIIVAVVGGLALINIAGVKGAVRFIQWAMAVKLVPLAFFVLAGLPVMHRANFAPSNHIGTQGLGRAMILILFAFTGMEITLSVSGEVSQPARTIPRALAISLSFVTLLYIAIQVTAQGILGDALAQSSTPLVDAMARVNPTLKLVMLAGAVLSMLGFMSSDMLGTPRVLFAFARDGMLPQVLGRVHHRLHTPYVAIACYALVAMVLALTGTFAELAVLSTLACTVIYILACLAAWRLARDGVAQMGTPLNFRWLGSAAVVGVASMLFMIALASRAEILGLCVVVGISSTVYLVQSRAALATAKT